MNVSRAGVGMYVTLVMALLQVLGIDVDEGMVTEVILAIVTLASAATWIYGQVARSDLRFGLFRK